MVPCSLKTTSLKPATKSGASAQSGNYTESHHGGDSHAQQSNEAEEPKNDIETLSIGQVRLPKSQPEVPALPFFLGGEFFKSEQLEFSQG